METHTTATVNVTADITPIGDGIWGMVANGNIVKTSEFFRDVTIALGTIGDELGTYVTVELLFGPHGVTVRGTTK